jgi:cytochrome P450
MSSGWKGIVASHPLVAVALISFVVVVLVYYASLPRLHMGIPYVPATARAMFGDLPAALAHQQRTGLLFSYMTEQAVKLNSPIVQFTFRPFSRPWVAIFDGREAQDIMTHRSKEFDRSNLSGDLVRAHAPKSQLPMLTNDQWRFNRMLVRETMSPKFLNTVAAARAFEAATDLISLWMHKARLAPNATYDVKEDILMAVIDVIWSATFGSEIGSCKVQSKHLASIKHVNVAEAHDKLTIIPSCQAPAAYSALNTLFDSSVIPLKSPFGYYHHWLAMKLIPRLRQAMNLRDRLVQERLRAAYSKFSSLAKDEGEVQSAIDLVVQREAAAASKADRDPMSASVTRYIHDELCLFLSAGSTTTAEAVCWGLKYLTAYPDIQREVRENMKAVFATSSGPGVQPCAEAIAKAELPWLEAFMYESLRHGSNMEGHMRIATCDTEILGYHIPKGTQMILAVSTVDVPVRTWRLTLRSCKGQAF